MAFLIGLVITAVAAALETWGFMMMVGMAHLNILEAIHPISYGVSFQFVLISLPLQALGVLIGALGDS